MPSNDASVQLLMTFPHAVIIIDTSGRILLCNDNTRKMLRYTSAELVGQPIGQIMPELATSPQIAGLAQPTLPGLLHSSTTSWQTVTCRRRDGKDINCELITSTLARRSGPVTAVLLREIPPVPANEEITEILSNVASALTALNDMDDIIVVLDSEWRAIYANDASQPYLGIPRHQLLNKVLWDVFPLLRNTQFEKAARNSMAKQKKTNFEEFYPNIEIWLEINLYPSERTLLVHAADVTKHRATQEMNQRLLNFLEDALGDNTERTRRLYRQQLPQPKDKPH